MTATQKSGAPRRRVRAASPRTSSSLERRRRAQLGRELLHACRAALRQFDGARAARRSQGGRATAVLARQILADAERLSEMLTRWQESEHYLDERANPRVIAIGGTRPSFEALCAEQHVLPSRARLLTLALELGMCKRVGGRYLAHRSNFARLNDSPTLLLAHMVVNVERMLRTAVYNASQRQLPSRLVERTAIGYLSSRDFAAFMALTRRSVVNFAEQQHRWLMGRGGDSSGGRGRRVSGVSAFIFRD